MQVMGHLLQACMAAGIASTELLGQADQRLSGARPGDWQPHSLAAALGALGSVRHRPPSTALQHIADAAARCSILICRNVHMDMWYTTDAADAATRCQLVPAVAADVTASIEATETTAACNSGCL